MNYYHLEGGPTYHFVKDNFETFKVKFMPTKVALKAMIEIAGFEILAQDGKNPERENFICRKISKPDRGYEDAKSLF